MPGGIFANMRIGSENELLANYILEHFSFVTRVPREEDVGIDFICSLFKSRAKMIEAGPLFSVQVKSNNDAIRYSDSQSINWLDSQENPLFIAVMDARKSSLDLYSTWRMLNVFLLFTPPVIRLMPMKKTTKDDVYYTKNKTRVDVYLGNPIVSISIDDLKNPKTIENRGKLIDAWIRLDRKNLARRESGLYWVEGPEEHITNESIDPRKMNHAFYAHPKNINISMDNLVRACLGALTDLHNTPVQFKDNELKKLEVELKECLRTNIDAFGLWHKKALHTILNL